MFCSSTSSPWAPVAERAENDPGPDSSWIEAAESPAGHLAGQPVHDELVGFAHVFATAQPVQFAPDLTLKVISSSALMLRKVLAFLNDQQRRVKDLDDIRGLPVQSDADRDRVFSDVVMDAALQDYGLAPAFLLGRDLRALCTDEGSAKNP